MISAYPLRPIAAAVSIANSTSGVLQKSRIVRLYYNL